MRRIMIVIALLCLGGCSASESGKSEQPETQVPRKQFYTDAEAGVFLQKLSGVTYPTTIRAASSHLGIDLARLGLDMSRPIHTQLIGPGSGVTQWHTSQLSQSYSIAFLHNINDKTPGEYRIYKVDIWKFSEKAQLYTDVEAEKFKSRLSQIEYPTTRERACALLGIDLARLTIPIGSMYGRSGIEWTRLSTNYWISFDFPILEPAPAPGDAYITEVRVYRLEKKSAD